MHSNIEPVPLYPINVKIMKIVIFDDHQFVIDAVVDFFKDKPDMEIVGTSTVSEGVVNILEANPDVDILISDVLTDEEIGLTLFENVQAMGHQAKIVVYSSIMSDFVKQFLFDYGVVAIVNKRESLEQLWETVRLAYENTKRVKSSQTSAEPPQLTQKEKDIARYLAKGLAAKEIAVLTDSSPNTINNQKNHMMEKFNCANSTELILKLIQMGYIKM